MSAEILGLGALTSFLMKEWTTDLRCELRQVTSLFFFMKDSKRELCSTACACEPSSHA